MLHWLRWSIKPPRGGSSAAKTRLGSASAITAQRRAAGTRSWVWWVMQNMARCASRPGQWYSIPCGRNLRGLLA